MATTEKDLIDAVRESLNTDGELNQLKAKLQMDIINLLDNSNKGSKTKIPVPPQDINLLNELIREYLDWIGYKYSSTVFATECNLSKQPLDRSLLLQTLCVQENENSKSLPLLCSLVETFKNLNSSL